MTDHQAIIRELKSLRKRCAILEELVVRLVKAEAKREREADMLKLERETHPNGSAMNVPSGCRR